MSLLTALMPTHAAITEHLTSAPGVSPCASVEVRDQSPVARAASAPVSVRDLSSGCASPNMTFHQAEPAPICMHKYIILQRDGREFPLVFSREIQHSHVVPWNEGYTPVSAGSFIICGSEVRLSPGIGEPGAGSSTLEIDPRPQDETILRAFLAQSAVAPVDPVNQVHSCPVRA